MVSRVSAVGLVVSMCLVVSFAVGAPPRGGAKSSPRAGAGNSGNARGANQHGKSLGGDWSSRTHGGPQFGNQSGRQPREGGSSFPGAAGNRNPNASAGEKGDALTARNRNNPQATGAQGATAGAAVEKRNTPNATGAQGAAAGAAAVNRNAPNATVAQGAAAGAAAVNRNAPNATDAQGAAAGAAAANRNNPQYTGAQGAAAGAAVANRNAPQYSGAEGAAAGYAAVRNEAYHPNMYGADWYTNHPAAWAAPGVAAGAAWVPATWGAVAAHAGYANAQPISYNYGVNVTAQNGNVMMGDQNLGTVQEFGQQAADLAQTGTNAETSDDDQWLPLGVYAMVRNEQQHPQLILQLSINKNGIIRGNYTDEATDHTLPIHGAAEKTTQRAAWTVGDNQNTVMEAGLNDLTGSEAPALIHKADKTEHWLLIRLEHPADGNGDTSATPAEK